MFYFFNLCRKWDSLEASVCMELVFTCQTLICYYYVAGKRVECGSAFNSASMLARPAVTKEVRRLTLRH
jgi:hypothetical protein